MWNVELVFRNPLGKIVPKAQWQQLPFRELMTLWAEGALRRDIQVSADTNNTVAALVPAARAADPYLLTLGDLLCSLFVPLHDQLSLANWLLTVQHVQPGEVPRVAVSEPQQEVVWCGAPQDTVESVLLDMARQHIYPRVFPLVTTAAAEPEDEAAAAEPPAERLLRQLLRDITNRDNATVLFLLNQTVAASQEDQFVYTDDITPTVFSAVRNDILKYRLPVGACVGTAAAFARLETGDHFGNELKLFPGLPIQDVAGLLAGRLYDTELLCLGSPYDLVWPVTEEEPTELFYMCTTPHHLGVRLVGRDLHTEPLQNRTGWTFSTEVGTALLSGRGVRKATRKA